MYNSLNEITDDAYFEKVCLDILRSANHKYKTLINSGSNEFGRTVKDPVDGITIIQDAFGNFIEAIVLECTTKRAGLRSKFLKKSEPNKGDIIKSIEKLKEIENIEKGIKKTIVLCTNRRIPSDLYKELKKICKQNKVELDSWDFSRLINYLEIDPVGQYIRHKYFKNEIELISQNLFEDIVKENIKDYKAEFDFFENSIEREIQSDFEDLLINTTGLVILKGESGTGKTTICIQVMEFLFNQEFPTLKLSSEIIESSNTLESAIKNTLEKHSPSLYGEPEQYVLSKRTILFIDDINRSNSPQKLLNKIRAWVYNEAKDRQLNFTIICPLWSRNVAFTPIVYEKNEFICEFEIKKFTVNECKLFAELNPEFQITTELLSSLEYDPFLLGFACKYNLASTKPDLVIKEFLSNELALASNTNNKLEEEYIISIKQLIKIQLLNKRLFSNESELLRDFSQLENQLTCIRELYKFGAILYNSKEEENKIIFRHDRIHEYFIKKVIAENFNDQKFQESVIFNPYFSEYVGKILKNRLNKELLNLVLKQQPLIAFYYLKEIGEPSSKQDIEFSNRIVEWFSDYAENEDQKCSKFTSLVNVLYNTESSIALKLSSFLKDSRAKMDIGFRNGECFQALNFFATRIKYELSIDDPYRDNVMAKYKSGYLEKSIEYILQILKDELEEVIFQRSALIYAGYLESEALSKSIVEFFKKCNNKKEVLVEAIWAILNCSKRNLKEDIKIFFDFWKVLPHNSKYSVEVYGKFQSCIGRINNINLDKVIIHYYDNCPELKGCMFHSLEKLDTPMAIEKHLTLLSQNPEPQLPKEFENHYFQLIYDKIKIKNPETLNKLKELWCNNLNTFLGSLAFEYWLESINKTNINLINDIPVNSIHYRQAIERRISIKDKSVAKFAFPFLKDRDFQDSEKIWCPVLFEMIKEELINNKGIDISGYLLSILEKDAEVLLEYYYKNGQEKRIIFQYGLYIGTQKSRKLSKEIFESTEDKLELFNQISSTYCYTNFYSGRKENLTEEKLNSLIEYLEFISDDEISLLVSVCNRVNLLGWVKLNIGTDIKETKISFEESERVVEHVGEFYFPPIENLIDEFFKNCKCACGKYKYCGLDGWSNKILDKGFTIVEFKNVIKDNLDQNFEIERFSDICEFIKYAGNKDDIPWVKSFSNNTNDSIEINKIIEDTIYAIEMHNL